MTPRGSTCEEEKEHQQELYIPAGRRMWVMWVHQNTPKCQNEICGLGTQRDWERERTAPGNRVETKSVYISSHYANIIFFSVIKKKNLD